MTYYNDYKALIPLALEGTETGKTRAGRALAKIAISINPELAFPGQRVIKEPFQSLFSKLSINLK